MRTFSPISSWMLLTTAVLCSAHTCVLADDGIKDQLISNDDAVRDAAVASILEARHKLIADLISIIEGKSGVPDNARFSAAHLLGEMHAEEASSALVDAMCQDVKIRVAEDNRYLVPFDAALIKIGRPAIPHLIKRITSFSDLPATKKCVGVLVNVCGGKRRTIDVLRIAGHEHRDDRFIQVRIAQAIELIELQYSEPNGEPQY